MESACCSADRRVEWQGFEWQLPNACKQYANNSIVPGHPPPIESVFSGIPAHTAVEVIVEEAVIELTRRDLAQLCSQVVTLSGAYLCVTHASRLRTCLRSSTTFIVRSKRPHFPALTPLGFASQAGATAAPEAAQRSAQVNANMLHLIAAH